MAFQSTPSTRRETVSHGVCGDPQEISIHSLHTEGDIRRDRADRRSEISIHSLHTEGDDTIEVEDNYTTISIHSLHTEGDNYEFFDAGSTFSFQSTPSTRRETVHGLRLIGL